MSDRHNLPRLERGNYQGFAAVFWSHSVEERATGWLNETFHRDFREVLIHAGAKYQVVCPAYCLMPDHFHLVWMGLNSATDQLNATQFLRKQVNRLLAGEKLVDRRNLERAFKLQHQPHDHVLTEEERKRNAFARTCFYVLANPERANLVKHAWEWPFCGAVFPGYPSLWPFDQDYWPLFWKLYLKARQGDELATEPGDAPA